MVLAERNSRPSDTEIRKDDDSILNLELPDYHGNTIDPAAHSW
jgi:hypothetical protein